MGGNSPCASCKLLRRRCAKDCVFAPYFPSDDPHKFAIVHKVFGASNVSKMLQELPVQQRADAVSSLVYEANARARDPVYGCVGAISYLQNQVCELQMQLAVAQAEILCIQMQQQEQQQQQQQAAALAPSLVQLEPDIDDDDDGDHKSYFLHPHHLLNFTSNNSSANVIYDSFKKESHLYPHDMVS
ncbi:UNVERIFIED_CONTAM: LOB domain-containing protein 12 [Sesamum angustifolium]|uniref:LOB domain-containing protein 12 n=1 Tax=Sesamum angustifolium TaxID=2727405 RepID=A0AAW2LD42_9LAMI